MWVASAVIGQVASRLSFYLSVTQWLALLPTGHLEDIEQKLYEMGLHPSLRNQVINFWAAEIKQPVPRNLQKRLAEERGAKPREGAEGEKEPEKYSVDTATGAIKVASTTDKMALTWDEAEKLSKNIKMELADKAEKGEKKVTYVYDSDANTVRMAREGEIGGTQEQAKELKRMAEEGKGKKEEESPFITDEDGNWMLNPKARVTGIELMALQIPLGTVVNIPLIFLNA